MKVNLFVITIFLGIASPVYANMDPKIHKKCLKASDYAGCIEIHSQRPEVKDRGKPLHSNLIKPTCDQRLTEKSFEEAVRYIGCNACHVTYHAALKGNKTYLNGNKENTKEVKEKMTQMAYSFEKNGPGFIERLGGIEKASEILFFSMIHSSMKQCPSLVGPEFTRKK